MSSIERSGIDRQAQLSALHLYGMAAAWNELLAEGPRRPVQPEVWLDRLIEAELADRQVRSLRYQLKAARFPVHRDLTGIDWAETPVPHAQIEQLASAAFMETAHNLILVGGTGTGKTHVSIAVPDPRPRGNRLECGYQWPDEMIVARIRHQRAGAGSSLSSPWAAVPRASSKSESSPASRRRDDEPRTGLGRRE